MNGTKKFLFLMLSVGLVLAGGCATSNQSNVSSRPWDHPVAEGHLGYEAPTGPGSGSDMK